MKLYVGNLGFNLTDAQLQSIFAEHGAVDSAQVIRNQETGRGRGFGFVEMADGEAQKAMAVLNGKDVEGRALTVNEARPMRPNSPQRGANGPQNKPFGKRSY
jgi:RNA recognition motif-containing protein